MAFYNKEIQIYCSGLSAKHTGRGLPCNLTSTPVTFQVPSSFRPFSASWHHPQLRLFCYRQAKKRKDREWGLGKKKHRGKKIYHNRAARKILGSLILSSCLNQAANQPGSTAIKHAISFSATGCSRKDYFNLYMEHPRSCNIQNVYRYFHSHPVLIYFAAVAFNHAR